MSDNNNDFLNNYGKVGADKTDKTDKPVKSDKPSKEIVIKDAPLPAYKYEQMSDFVPPERTETAPPAPPNRKKLIITIAAAAAVLLVLILVLVLLLNQGIEMIDLKGMEYTKAQLWAQEKGVNLDSTETYNDEFAEGVVFEQATAVGTRVHKGDIISVTVSKGHDLSEMIPLPDLKTMTMSEVQTWANENFMSKVRITTEFSDTIPSGTVIRYEVNDDRVTGETVRRDSPVYVVASKGPEDEAALQVTVPDFKTISLSEAYIFANANGLTLTVQQQYDDFVAAGSVISQSVKAQEKVSRGTEIVLVVSQGKKITVPSFSGYTKEAATAKATELGIPIAVTEKYSGASAGAFISQSIAADTIYKAGDILELKFSLGNKVILASYIGQTRDAIETWAQGLNAQGASIKINASMTQSSSPAGTIIYQDPANKSVSYKSTVNITVSLGKVVYVPDFVGDGGNYNAVVTREDAIAMCDAVGLIPKFVKENSAGRLPGEVWSQSLAAGSETTQGTTITLNYVESTPIDIPGGVPNFSGLDKPTATANYGNKLRIIFAYADSYTPGYEEKVVSQSLTIGTTVASGTTITLYLGPAAPVS